MKIIDILNSGKTCLSFEVFPPKKSDTEATVTEAAAKIAALKPGYMSVTYGAGGSTDIYTVKIAQQINRMGVTPLAHLSCIGAGRDRIRAALEDMRDKGIENILALRGDLPEGVENPLCDYLHASDLVTDIKQAGGFCIGGACYPEGHPESESIAKDIEGLKIKVDAGCEFLTTQMFFDNDILYNFMYRLLKAGVDVPVVPGIMPVTNAKQIKRITSISGTALPKRFERLVDRYGDNPEAMKQAGIAYATEQIIDLYANGFNGVHVYSMNKPEVAEKISENLSEIIK